MAKVKLKKATQKAMPKDGYRQMKPSEVTKPGRGEMGYPENKKKFEAAMQKEYMSRKKDKK